MSADRTSAKRPPRSARASPLLWLAAAPLLVAAGCVQAGPGVDLPRDVRLTVLHTSDWHSRLLPYDMDVSITDENLGLLQENEPFGGVARLSTLVRRERANAGRSIFVDSGDCFQGAPIFNEFMGEVEFRAMSLLAPDGVVVGNHEFDNGVRNLVEQAASFARFPLLAANYRYRPVEGDVFDPQQLTLADVTRPYTMVNREGLVVAVIGVANFSSLSSMSFGDNSMGIQPVDIRQSVQQYVDLLRPAANVIVLTSHAGLEEDEQLIRETCGIDLLMGGHLHIVLDPPRVITDACDRPVVLTHSGAFLKYLGRLDTVLRESADVPGDYEVVSHRYQVIPIDDTVPEDAQMLAMVEPYAIELGRRLDLTRVIAYAPQRVRRFGSDGGDSPLGNLVADAIRLRRRVETDFAATNSLGIRSDITQGPVTLETLFNVFPFPNTIATMTLSGNEVQELLDYASARSSERGCNSQLQVSGVQYTMDCSQGPELARADSVRIGGEAIAPGLFYSLATNDYMAQGGSGFRVLRFNSTQQDSGVSLREAVIDYIRQMPLCLDACELDGLPAGECPLLLSCRSDLVEYNARFCDGFVRFSDMDYCLDSLAPACLELSEDSDLDLCIAREGADCADYFFSSEREACYDEAAVACDGAPGESPRVACAHASGAVRCVSRDVESPWELCMEHARESAELACMDLPCLLGETDGRIGRMLPTNTEIAPLSAGEPDAVLQMERLDGEPHEDACY